MLENLVIPLNFIGITETGLKDKIKAKNSSILPRYNHFDCCTASNRGGARIYISEGFNTSPRDDLTLYKKNEIESVVKEVVYENGRNNFIVACIYKHPSADNENFLSLYSNFLDKILSENKKAIIMGDSNLTIVQEH